MIEPSDSLPALLGGPAIRPQGPPDWPLPDEDVCAALHNAYRDGSWGKYDGGNVEALEERLARYHGVAHALTCASGTFAVELALRALKIGPGDEVILAAYDYGGNFLCVHAVGAMPVLVDVAPGNWNFDPARLTAAVSPATRAVIVSHLHGGVVPMQEVTAFCAARGLRVIEDAAQAPGSIVQGRKAGTLGDVGIVSFGGSKLLTAGRGGALITPHPDIHHRARLWLFRGNLICPLSELQAAVLLPQLGKLDIRNAHRARSVHLLGEQLHDIPGIRLFASDCPEAAPGYYKAGFQFDAPAFGLSRSLFVAAARAEGVGFDEGFRALNLGRAPTRFRQSGDLAQAERAHHGTLLLHHPVLLGSPADIAEVAATVRKIHANVDRLKTRQ